MSRRQVWKYPLPPNDTISMPIGARVLTAQLQQGVPVLWALVNPEAPKAPREFRVVWTGQQLEYDITRERLVYVATYQQTDGLVYHVFEVLSVHFVDPYTEKDVCGCKVERF